jgi:glycosyltransferase involved in cell wall biosynthesis
MSPDHGGTASMLAPTRSLRVGFIMTTEVGLRTQYLNWRSCLTPDLGIDPTWIVITWWKEDGLLERYPIVPPAVRARVRMRQEASRGLACGPFDALFVAGGHALQGMNRHLAKQPFFTTMDSTRKLLLQMGEHYGKRPTRFGPFGEWKERDALWRFRNAAAVFPWSQWAASSLVEDYGVDPSVIHVIPPGVDVDAWRCERREPRGGPVHILFVGGDFVRKGGDLLLKWAESTRERDWVLHLVTRDAAIPSSDRVRVYSDLSSNDPRLVALYHQADIFALPTRADCYSLAGIEAMAAGLPVILSSVGGIGDIVRDGETGFLIPSGDYSGLGDRLECLIRHPEARFRMGLAARDDAEARYDARKNIRRTVEVMRGLL